MNAYSRFVERRRSRRGQILEQVRVPIRGRWQEKFTRQRRLHLGVRPDGGDAKEEGLISSGSGVEELEGCVGYHIRGVVPGQVPKSRVISRHGGVVVPVCLRINQNCAFVSIIYEACSLSLQRTVCVVPAGRIRLVVGCCRESIHQLASVVRVVACLLQPNGEVLFMQAIVDELLVAPVWQTHVSHVADLAVN